jgi:hypothetical protein
MSADLLDWIVLMDFKYYVNDDNTCHWYLKRSLERFTSEEILLIYEGSMSSQLRKRWNWAVANANRKYNHEVHHPECPAVDGFGCRCAELS